MKDAPERAAQVGATTVPADLPRCPRDRHTRINTPVSAIDGELQARGAGGTA